MKTTLCTILLLFLFASVPLCAQGRSDSTASGPQRTVSAETGPVTPAASGSAVPGAAATSPRFIDENGDGIDDRTTGKGPGIRRGKDRFIDEDGDGICDSRAGGLGLRRHGAGAGAMTGTDGKGRMRRLGSGGKP